MKAKTPNSKEFVDIIGIQINDGTSNIYKVEELQFQFNGTFINCLFNINDVVFDIDYPQYKRKILDIKDGYYYCDGNKIKIEEQINYKKFDNWNDIVPGEALRIQNNPSCFNIIKDLGDKVIIKSIHGDGQTLEVNKKDLLTERGYPIKMYIDV